MAKFCGKCGSKLDETTGLCPKCDVEQPEKASAGSAKKTKKSKGKKIRHFLLKVILCALLLGTLAAGVTGALVYFDVVDIPVVSAIFDKMDLSTWKNHEDNNEDESNYKVDPVDAEKYYNENSQILSELEIKDSKEILTEKKAVKVFSDRGFDSYPITTEYDMNGKYSNPVEISGSSSKKHPIYTTYYVNTAGEIWSVSIIDGDVIAYPVSYNMQSKSGIEVVAAESDVITSYDSETNKFFKTIPDSSVLTVKVVKKVNADSLKKMTIEVMNKW